MLYLATLSGIDAPVDPDAMPEAVAWFRNRVPVASSTWDALDETSRRRTFRVAGATSLDVLAHVFRAADRAVASGTRFVDFKREVGEQLAGSWAGDSPGRLGVVFRNATQSSYSAGRYAQSTDPDTLAMRPLWRYETILDSRTTPICSPLDGITLPASDPFWATHYPPLHHQCRSGVTTLRTGDIVAPPSGRAGPQQGWGATPAAGEFEPDVSGHPEPLQRAWREWRSAREAP